MNIFASALVATLLFASSSTWAEDDRSADLRYCLDMNTNIEIAKCAGEISAGDKRKPLPKHVTEKILAKKNTSAPINANKPAITPAIINDKPANGLPPGKN